VRHELTAEEKRARQDAGLLATDALEVRIPKGSRSAIRANAGS
jgi:hypothetical protein